MKTEILRSPALQDDVTENRTALQSNEKKLTVADLWHIQRLRRERQQRRYL